MEENTLSFASEASPENHWIEQKKMQKKLNLSLALNLILFAAVVIVYILVLKKPSNTDAFSAGPATPGGQLNIAFVNSDTLIENYGLVKNLKKDLEKKKELLESQVTSRQKAFETKVSNYQNNLQKNLITAEQAKNAESKLMAERQEIMEMSEKFTRMLAQQEMEMNVRVQDSIINMVHRLNNKGKYDYVLGFSKGGGILFANPKNDITRDILKKLNEEFSPK